MPIVYGALAIIGLGTAAWGAREAKGALDSASQLTKWGIAAGGLYVTYSALKSGGVIK